MAERVHFQPNLVYSLGTQVVSLVEILGQNGRVLHPRGAVDRTFHQREYERLRAELEQAYQDCRLPEAARGEAALHELLVRTRLGR